MWITWKKHKNNKLVALSLDILDLSFFIFELKIKNICLNWCTGIPQRGKKII